MLCYASKVHKDFVLATYTHFIVEVKRVRGVHVSPNLAVMRRFYPISFHSKFF